MDNQLVEKWDALLMSEDAPVVTSKESMAQLLENEEAYMMESANAVADMAQYTPILVPAVRRIFPNLLANEIVGVQSMNAPTGYAYALRYAYAGVNGADIKGVNNAANDRGTFGRDLTGGAVTFASFAILASVPTFDFGTGTPTVTFVSGAVTAVGNVTYAEAGRCLVTMPMTAAALVNPGVTGTSSVGGVFTVVALFNNEAGYNLIFKNYAGPVSTAAGEVLNNSTMKNMKMSLERVAIEAQTRKLKAEYTVELAQDLKNVHGLDAEAELINILEYEISAELDRELVDLINAKATITPNWVYGGYGVQTGGGVATNTADGRWEGEKIRTLYTRILRESNQVALQTRRGQANFIICSSNVAAALESLSGFMYSAVPGTVKPTLGVAKIGTLDGRFAVYLDTFAYTDYITLGYKGSSAFDTGIIYCPYVPLMLQKVTDPETFQPKLAFMTRDAICANLFGAEKYYRKFKVDFSGSSFSSGPQWGNDANPGAGFNNYTLNF